MRAGRRELLGVDGLGSSSFSSSRKAENYQTFSDPARWDRVPDGQVATDEKLNVMQWQNTKAVKRTKHTLPVVR